MPRPVLLIAGGSRGIGAATAKLAGARGYDVAVNYKTNSNAATAVIKAVEKGGGKAVAIQGDMALENDIERVFDTATDTFGSLTHFVHSSGIIGEASRLDDASAKTIREVLDVDTFGALLCLRTCMRRMSTRHGGKGGAVVMLSSMAAPLGGEVDRNGVRICPCNDDSPCRHCPFISGGIGDRGNRINNSCIAFANY